MKKCFTTILKKRKSNLDREYERNTNNGEL